MKDVKNDNNEILDENELEDMVDTIVFPDEDGNEIEFAEVEYFEYDNKFYCALVPVEELEADNPEGASVCFCSVTEDEQEDCEILEMVEDEELQEKLFEEFLRIQEEEGGCDCGCHCDCDDCGEEKE